MLLNEVSKKRVEEYLIEATLTQLRGGSSSAFPNRNETAGVRITQKSYEKYGDSQLLVQATCDGETDQYSPSILFEGVQFTDPSDPNAIRLGDLHIQPISEDLNVKVLCTCPDFRWTFAWYNANDNALIGNPPPPYNSTGQRPPRNPSGTPGLCKHLIRLGDDLRAEQFMK